MMFDKKTVELYTGITAPKELKNKVLENARLKARGKHFDFSAKSFTAFASLAAAAVCVVFALTMLANPNISAEISVGGVNPKDSLVHIISSPASPSARTVDAYSLTPASEADAPSANESICILIDLSAESETEISSSTGFFITSDGTVSEKLLLNGIQTFRWESELSQEQTAYLYLKCGKQNEIFTLSKDTNEDVWILKSKE